MKSLTDYNFMKYNITKEWLISKGFCYNKIFSEKDSDAYTYRFPVHKYGSCTTLDGEITIFINDGNVKLNVYDSRTRHKYAPFYCVEYGNYGSFIDEINNRFLCELNKLGIKNKKEKTNGNKNKKVK